MCIRDRLEYLERSEKQKAIDKQTLADEQRAAGNTSPKHAGVGFGGRGLRGDHPAEWWTSDEALKDAHNIVTWQVADGGWSKNIDMVSRPRAPGDLYDANNENRFPDLADFDKPVDPSWHYIATLDNDSTWMQIRFLARVATALVAAHRDADAAPICASVERGVEYLLDSQYPNGGWPQVWPLEGGYHDAITINDDAMTHAVEILHDVAEGAADLKFLPAAMVKRAGPAAQRGIDCLLKLQITENGVKTAWAQQYDALTLEPTSARNYEMGALTSDESFPVVEFFMRLPNPTPAEVAAVHAACVWFVKVEIFGFRYGSGNFMADRQKMCIRDRPHFQPGQRAADRLHGPGVVKIPGSDLELLATHFGQHGRSRLWRKGRTGREALWLRPARAGARSRTDSRADVYRAGNRGPGYLSRDRSTESQSPSRPRGRGALWH